MLTLLGIELARSHLPDEPVDRLTTPQSPSKKATVQLGPSILERIRRRLP